MDPRNAYRHPHLRRLQRTRFLHRPGRPESHQATRLARIAVLPAADGVVVHAQSALSDAASADAVLVGSGIKTREVVADPLIMSALRLDPQRQLIGAQCSGTLVLAKLGLIGAVPACTDLTTKPWVQEAGVEVLNQPFFAAGNIATAGGCFASPYLAAWIIARCEGEAAAREALHYVAPVGEKDEYVDRAMKNIAPYLDAPTTRRALPRAAVVAR